MSLTYPSSWADAQLPYGDAAALLQHIRRLAALDGRQPSPPPACVPIALSQAYRACVDITRTHSRSFFLSTQLLPAQKRLAIRALYAFCRTSDDLVDRGGPDAVGDLARWVDLAHAPHAPAGHAVLQAWKNTARRYCVPSHLIDELLAGVAMDLTVTRYETFDELWLYCYRVASVVGLISMWIIGADTSASSYAIKLGVALQLTNILRDIGEDAGRGRIYLPQEDLQRFGLSDADILGRRHSARFRALMRFEIARAHSLYEEAWPGIALLARDSQLAVGAAAEIYRGILDQIAATDYNVYARRARISLAGKLLRLPRIWGRVRAQRLALHRVGKQ